MMKSSGTLHTQPYITALLFALVLFVATHTVTAQEYTDEESCVTAGGTWETTLEEEQESDSESETTRISERCQFSEKPTPEERAERIEERQEHMEERRSAIAEGVRTRIVNLAENMQRHMEAAVARLLNIGERMETRITSIESQGVDVSASREALEEAMNILWSVETDLNTLNDAINSAITSGTPRDDFANARARFLSIRQNIRTAHELLRSALSHLKEAAENLEQGVSEAVRNDE